MLAFRITLISLLSCISLYGQQMFRSAVGDIPRTNLLAIYNFVQGAVPTYLYDSWTNTYLGIFGGTANPTWLSPRGLRFSQGFVNMHYGLEDVFPGAEGTISVTAKVSELATWSDGLDHSLFGFLADGNNYVAIAIYPAPAGTQGRVSFVYVAGGVGTQVFADDLTSTGFLTYTLTWSNTSNIVSGYLNGILIGSAANAGTWSGTPQAAYCVFGAWAINSARPWSGDIANVGIYSRALDSGEVKRLSLGTGIGTGQLDVYGRLIGATGDSILQATQAVLIQYPYHVGQMLRSSYFNVGVSGQTTTQIQARYAADVLALSPAMVILEGGLNDDHAIAWADSATKTNYISMLASNQAAGIRSVVVLLTPANAKSDADMAVQDAWNVGLAALATTYGAIIADSRSTLGQFRAGGDAGNLWDLKAAYNDGSGIHLTQAGAVALAGVISDAIVAALGL